MRQGPSLVTIESKTWDLEWITNARFGPDGQTVVFSSAHSGNVPQLYVIRPHTVIPQPLGEPGTELLSISRAGELAVLTNAHVGAAGPFEGTLARMTMDGAPRPWLEDVSEADWSPDGSTLAITRIDPTLSVLEYPVGHVLYRNSGGYVSDLRVSPDGTQVAFFDHPIFGDDRGFLRVVDRQGTVRTLAGELEGEEGLAWSEDGRRIVFSGSKQGGEYQPLVVDADGTATMRQALPSVDAVYVQDIARGGQLLAMRDDLRYSIRALVPGETSEREFPWLDAAVYGTISPDHRWLVFGDYSVRGGLDYAVALRDLKTDKVVNLGPGVVGGVSSDGNWASALVPSSGEAVFYPTGAGELRKLARGPVDRYLAAPAWIPGGHVVEFCATEKSQPPRCYVQEMTAPAPTPVTPAGVTFGIVSADGRALLVRTSSGTFELVTIGSGADPAPVNGLTSHDTPIAWTGDGRGVYVQVTPDLPARVEKVDFATGARTRVKELTPPDRSGVSRIFVNQWLADGRGYSYAYARDLSKLFIISGALH